MTIRNNDFEYFIESEGMEHPMCMQSASQTNASANLHAECRLTSQLQTSCKTTWMGKPSHIDLQQPI